MMRKLILLFLFSLSFGQLVLNNNTVMITEVGGYAIKLTNKTGGAGLAKCILHTN